MENEKKAFVTVGLAAVNVMVFLWLSLGGMTEEGAYMLQHGAAYTPYILENKEYYRLFTSMFLHFGFPHLMNNMITLLVLGCNLEPIVGKIRFFLIYILSGLGGNLLSMAVEVLYRGIFDSYTVSAGASGAIFGLTGALLCLTIFNHGRAGNVTKQNMILMAVISLYMGFTSEGVDNWAHVGGLLTGILVTVLICRKRNFKRRTVIED